MNNLKTLLRVCLAAVLLSFLPQQLQATHIIGGDLEYDIVSRTATDVTLNIKLSLYRDCDPSSLDFDANAEVGIYSSALNTQTLAILDLPLVGSRTEQVGRPLDDFCTVVNSAVCVETTYYEGQVTLQLNQDGFVIAYRRCCRNDGIVNITDDLDTGMTLTLDITREAIDRANGNESLEYRNWPPIYICRDQPLVFDHGADDAENDSIVYSLCTPLAGGTIADPKPSPANYRLTNELVNLEAAASVNNLLIDGTPLAIDPVTGEMTVTPGTIGKYVVGVCASEYDRETGALLSVSRRDFQFNVLPCDEIDATFAAANPICGSLDVTLDNTSSVIQPEGGYEWYVDGALIGQDTSRRSFDYTFPDYGTYSVELVAGPGTGCETRDTQVINVVDTETFIVTSQSVCAGDEIALNPLAPEGLPFTYQWSPANLLDDPTAQNPIATVNATTTFSVTITSTDQLCATTLQTVITAQDTPTAGFSANQADCTSFDFTNGSNADSYFWDFGVTSEVADTAVTQDASYTYSAAGTYTVTLIATNASGCVDTTTQQIVVPQSNVGLQLDNEVTVCAPTYTIVPTATSSVTYTYFDVNNGQIGAGDSLTVAVSGTSTIVVVATDDNACLETDTITINGGPVDLTVPDTVIACGINDVNFGIVNNDLNDTLTFTWGPDSIFDATTINNIEPVFTAGFGVYNVTLTATNQFNCSETYDILLVVLDDNGTLGFDWSPSCDGADVSFTNTGNLDFGFVWDFGGLGTSTARNPSFTFPAAGSYTVTLSSVYDTTCIATVRQEVTVTDVMLAATAVVTDFECGAGRVSIDLSAEVMSGFTGTNTYSWTFDNASPATSSDSTPTIVVSESGDLAVSLTVATDNDCSVTYDTTINVQLPSVDLGADVTICPGTTATLNENFNPDYTYTWTPANGFDPNTPNPAVSESGTYVVEVSTTAGDINCVGTDTIVVTVASPINMTLSNPDGDIIQETVNNESNQDGTNVLPEVNTCGEEVSITANVEAGTTVEWTGLDGNPLSTDNPAGFNPTGRDTVIAIATDQFGCMAADTLVIVNRAVNVEADPASTEVNVCASQDTVVGVINQNPDDMLTFQWDANPIITSRLDSAYVTVAPSAAGDVQLSVTISNQYGCESVVEFTVSVSPFEPNSFPTTVDACFGEDTPLNPGGTAVSGYEYEWSPMEGDFSNPANPIVNLESDQTYTVTVTDPATSCSETSTIEVNVAPDLMFEATSPQDTALCFPGDLVFSTTHAEDVVVSWYDMVPFGATPLATADSYTVSPANDGDIITVYAEAVNTTTGCRDTLTFTASLREFDPGVFPETVNACSGEDTPLNPNGTTNPNYVYTWEPNVGNDANPTVNLTEDTEFTVVVTDPQTGCSLEDTIFVNVSEAINFTATPTDTVLCAPGTFTVVSSNEAGASVVWYSDAALTMEIATGNTVDVTLENEGSVTIYGVATEPEFGCTEQLTVTATYDVINDGLPDENPQGCFGEGDVVLFSNGANTNYTYAYAPADCVDTSDPANPVYTCDESGALTVTVTNPATGCSVDVPVQVDITNISDLVGSADPSDVVLGGSTDLVVTGCTGDCSYNWIAPNGTIDPNGNTATATPSEAGELVYTVEVTNNGCIEIVEILVTVTEVQCVPDRVFLPNAFSPNGDGTNDVLRVRSTFVDRLQEFDLMIFNRWGQEMYRSFNPLDGWDGTFQGESLEPDVYGYYLRVVCPNGEELIQKGNITILR